MMGQRLNLEIKRDGELLANAYYHWSGYTSSALELIEQVLIAIPTVKEQHPVLEAVRLLEATNAGMNAGEKDYATKTIEGFDANQFQDPIHRNEGLISISPKGIECTQYWEEARAELDLETKTIAFDVCYYMDRDHYLKVTKSTDKDYESLPMSDLDISSFTFDEFEKVNTFIQSLVQEREYAYRQPDNTVFLLME